MEREDGGQPAGSTPRATKGATQRPSRARLRLGVLLLLLWWLPIWLLAPAVVHLLGLGGGQESVAGVTTVLVVGQTVLGLGGAWLAGTQVVSVLRKVPRKRAVSTLWALLRGRDVDDVLRLPPRAGERDAGPR